MNAENTPVDPRNFTTAATRFDEALSAYRAASARVDDAQAALEALECRAPFAYAVTGPDGEEDEYVIDAKCTYSQGHAGSTGRTSTSPTQHPTTTRKPSPDSAMKQTAQLTYGRTGRTRMKRSTSCDAITAAAVSGHASSVEATTSRTCTRVRCS